MKILLAIDGSKFSDAALEFVLSQNRPGETQVRVLHVVEPIALTMPLAMAGGYVPELDKLQHEQVRQAGELVNRAADKLRAAGFQVDTVVHQNNARISIIDLASDWPADLIVLGSHGRKGMDRFFLGSVSEFVARHASCSVEIVRIPRNR